MRTSTALTRSAWSSYTIYSGLALPWQPSGLSVQSSSTSWRAGATGECRGCRRPQLTW